MARRKVLQLGIALGIVLGAIVGYNSKCNLPVLRSKFGRKNQAADVLFALKTTAHTIQGPKYENDSHTTPDERKEYDGYVSYPDRVPLKLKCSTCAFVVGSGHLLDSKKGSEIDSMDCVIRSNDAPTKGFEDDVGTKTTVRSVARRSMEIIRKSGREILEIKESSKQRSPTIILSIFHPSVEEEFEITRNLFPHLHLFISTVGKFRELLDVYRSRVSKMNDALWSNGFRTLYFAHEVCDIIHVYGINDENFCDHVLAKDPGYVDVPYHYYGESARQKNCEFISRYEERDTQAHQFTKEKILFRKLIKEWRNLHFHAPEWSNKTRD